MRRARQATGWLGMILGCALVLGVPAPEAKAARFETFIANRNSKVYHRPNCSAARRLSVKNRAMLPGRPAVLAGEYTPCSICHPDEPEPIQDRPPVPVRPRPDAQMRLVATVRLQSPDDDQQQQAQASKLKFSRDIAPILNGNCMGCHNGNRMRGEFDLSTFQNMMKGSQSGEVIVPGKPEESLLVTLVETRKMPRNANNRPLADVSIAKIRQWVKEGALLDQGVSPSATLDKIAPTAQQMRMEELAKLTPEQRDQKLKETALERWKKASATSEPKMTSGKNFLLFSNLPESRAQSALKLLEDVRTKLGGLLGEENAGSLTGPEKISVYVFNDVNAYAEYVRAVEHREPEENLQGNGNLGVQAPYLTVVDPLAGGPEPEQPKKKSSRRSKKADDEEFATGPDRSLNGVLADVLATSVMQAAGNPPMWLSTGMGAYFASLVEARSPYLMRLRVLVAEQGQLGWNTKANEALGDMGTPETVKAFGLALCEWMGSSYRQQFPMFVRWMLGGTAKLDDSIQQSFGAGRQQLLDAWGRWVATHYGPLLRKR